MVPTTAEATVPARQPGANHTFSGAWGLIVRGKNLQTTLVLT